MTILGIDPGLAIVGYGVINVERGASSVVDYGVINTPKEDKLADRLAAVYKGMHALFDKFKPDCTALEELFFVKNITTGIPVAEARGVILLACNERCKHLYEFTPLQIKQAMTGYGKADKRQIQFMVTRMLNLKEIPRPDDAADALAVALTCAQTARMNDLFAIH